jgi:glycerol uptake facilitator-like aquaporin
MKIRELSYEFVGSAILLIAIVGSSFMAAYLKADWALGLLINAAVTAAVLAIIIKIGGPVSGAHYNPVITLVMFLLKKITIVEFATYVVAQILGALTGVLIANTMFDSDFVGMSTIDRGGTGLFIGEIVATMGLLYLALACDEKSIWKILPLWIFAGYFFTSSTSFANSAVTIARVFTEAPSGISSNGVAVFILAQVIGAVIALVGAKVEKR